MWRIMQTNALYNSEFGQLTTAKISSWKSIFSMWSFSGAKDVRGGAGEGERAEGGGGEASRGPTQDQANHGEYHSNNIL